MCESTKEETAYVCGCVCVCVGICCCSFSKKVKRHTWSDSWEVISAYWYYSRFRCALHSRRQFAWQEAVDFFLCTYYSREDQRLPHCYCPQHITGSLWCGNKIIVGGEQGRPKDKQGFQVSHGMNLCLCVISVCVCESLVSLCTSCMPGWEVVGLSVFAHHDCACGIKCALACVCVSDGANSRTPSRPPCSRLPGLRSVAGHYGLNCLPAALFIKRSLSCAAPPPPPSSCLTFITLLMCHRE